MKIWTKLSIVALTLLLSTSLRATEGMWIPTLLKAVEDDMQAMGLELSAEDIYSINKSSLKDAIVHFGGGCTAELISDQGLLLTNHHCGYSQIQSHSSLENNYLRDGFWASSLAAELPNDGLTATLIDRIVDVTDKMSNGVTSDMTPESVAAMLKENAVKIEEAYTSEFLEASVRAYNYGNSYFVIVTKTYKDVRLVGTPPDAIGKFGGDTDNWIWPRHTGDFSIFRIYADGSNDPAEYAESNVPYSPKQHLKVSLDGVNEGDFTMVFGFPGRTEQYLISDAVEYQMNVANPMKIHMRDESLAIIDAAMRADEKTKIQYASKQSSISNAWKKWKGQNRGLKRMDALSIKKELELAYNAKAQEKGGEKYKDVIKGLSKLYAEIAPYQKGRDLLIEYFYYGPEIVSFSRNMSAFGSAYSSATTDEEKKALIDKYQRMANNYFDDYDVSVDRAVFDVLTPLYSEYLLDELEPECTLKGSSNWKAYGDKVFKNSVVTDREACLSYITNPSSGKIKKFEKSYAAILGAQVVDDYREKVADAYNEKKIAIDAKMKVFVEGLEIFFPDNDYWADANSTLRLTYGRAEGSEPNDGMTYKFFTTADGILDKYSKGTKDYELPDDFAELLKLEEYGKYADENGELRVCFTGSNHTTGGNSGSPALNGKGHLVGLNFDRSWESTMSDIMFDPDQCRNIMVDIRYILFIIDKYAGAKRLIDEMDLVVDGESRADTELEVEEEIFSIAERMPHFKKCENPTDLMAEEGCTQQMIMSHIQKNVKYPQLAIESGIQGKVYVQMIINKKGAVSEAKVVRGVSDVLDKEALRAVNSLPIFEPAEQQGKSVKVKQVIPVSFRLN